MPSFHRGSLEITLAVPFWLIEKCVLINVEFPVTSPENIYGRFIWNEKGFRARRRNGELNYQIKKCIWAYVKDKELCTGTPNSDIRKLCTVHCGKNVNKPSVPHCSHRSWRERTKALMWYYSPTKNKLIYQVRANINDFWLSGQYGKYKSNIFLFHPLGSFPSKMMRCVAPEFFVLISSHCSTQRTQNWRIIYVGFWSIGKENLQHVWFLSKQNLWLLIILNIIFSPFLFYTCCF